MSVTTVGDKAAAGQEERQVWYPNRLQWAVIWIASALAFALFLDGAEYREFVFMKNRLAIGSLWFGVLLVWQLSKPASFTWRPTRSFKIGVVAVMVIGLAALGMAVVRQRDAARAAALRGLGFEPDSAATH